MRANEFVIEGDISPSMSNLVSTLETLRSRTDQIRVDSLVNLVRKKPGSEMFNVDILSNAYKENPVIKKMIRNIRDDDTGVKYVYLKGLTANDDEALPDQPEIGGDVAGGPRNPEQTVSAMAKRASAKRT
jgi:hypothetical protein